MSDSQVIARKFRPKTFDQVVGQEAITRTLTNAINTGRIHHAYLFAGARGVGKTTTARILAKALNCAEGVTSQPCGVCASCREIAASSSIDVLEMDAASNTGVDNVRDVIINPVQIAPARDRFKIFIIDEVHQLSSAAFNALLKTLEEPPRHVAFIMATTELHKVPETILSRCQVFEFRTITIKKIFDQLRHVADDLGIKISEKALHSIARAGEGSMRDAESALDQVISFAGNEVADEDVSAALGLVDIETLTATLGAVAQEDAGRLLRIVDEVVSRGYDLRNFCRELMVHTRALLVTKIAGFDKELVQMPQGEGEMLVRLSEAFSEQDLLRIFSILTKTEQEIRVSSEPRFQLEMGLIKLAHARRLYLLEDALKQIAEIESRLTGPVTPSAGGSSPPRDVGRGTPAPKLRSSRSPQRTANEDAEERTGATASPPERDSEKPDATPAASLSPQSARLEEHPAPSVLSPVILDEPYEAEPELPPERARSTAKLKLDGPEAVEKIKAMLESRRKMLLLSALDQAESIRVDGQFLRVSFQPTGGRFKTQIEARDNRKTIEEVCREVLGRPVALSATVSGQANAESLPSPKRNENVIREQAENHPAVRAIVDKFRGEIVEVIKPDN